MSLGFEIIQYICGTLMTFDRQCISLTVVCGPPSKLPCLLEGELMSSDGQGHSVAAGSLEDSRLSSLYSI